MFRFLKHFLVLAAFLLPFGLKAEDLRHVSSPNGQLEFQIFVEEPEGALLSRLGYEILSSGKPLIGASWMGLDIFNQEPFLGEKIGLMQTDTGSNPTEHYNSLLLQYMQNGSLGRRLNIEVRAYNDAIAFRYIIPRSTPLAELLIRDEATQFNFAQPGVLKHLPEEPDFDIPFAVEVPGAGWVVIASAGDSAKYPDTYLAREGEGLQTTLARSKKDPEVAYSGTTPLTGPWRVVLTGPDKKQLLQSETLRNLNH